MKPTNNLQMKKRLRRWDDVEVPMEGEFFERLHDKIMSKIEEIEMETPAPTPPPPSPTPNKPVARPMAPQPLERYKEASSLGRYTEAAQKIFKKLPLHQMKS